MVTAVLLLSLAVSVGGRLLISYGEAQGKEMDMAHADDVQDSMLGMRGSMYTLLDAGDTRTHIVNRVTLGTFGNPYLAVARSSGTLSVEPAASDFSISVFMGPPGSEALIDTVSGSIIYRGNMYYFEDHAYHFEGGAIIVDEGGSMAMSSPPSFEFRRTPSGYGIMLSFYGMGGGEVSVSGIESVIMKVRMESYASLSRDLMGQNILLRVNSFAERVWREYFVETMTNTGLVSGVDYAITDPVDWNSGSEFLTLELRNMQFITERMGVMGVTI